MIILSIVPVYLLYGRHGNCHNGMNHSTPSAQTATDLSTNSQGSVCPEICAGTSDKYREVTRLYHIFHLDIPHS